jgi:hypothetical protein
MRKNVSGDFVAKTPNTKEPAASHNERNSGKDKQ